MGDFGAIGRLAGAHKVAANNNDCVAQYLNAGGNQKGSDIDIGPPLSFTVVLARRLDTFVRFRAPALP